VQVRQWGFLTFAPIISPNVATTEQENTMPPTVTASVQLPVALRSRLEHVRLARAERCQRVPRLRELIIEAITKFVDEELVA